MRPGRLQTCGGLALLAALVLGTSPVFAEQAWAPKVSSPDRAASGDGRELQQGWFPVVIHPPKPVEVEPPRPSPLQKSVEEKSAPGEQHLGQKAVQLETAAVKKEPSKVPEGRAAASSLAESYCTNISDAAADARFAWQMRTLSEMDKELQRRIVILEKRTAEYREWLARRDEFVKKAQETLVSIYARMRPDAAASQLASMEEETAAAVLTKLNPRISSAILNEMPPGPAARLTTMIAGAAKVDNGKGAAQDRAGGRS